MLNVLFVGKNVSVGMKNYRKIFNFKDCALQASKISIGYLKQIKNSNDCTYFTYTISYNADYQQNEGIAVFTVLCKNCSLNIEMPSQCTVQYSTRTYRSIQ